MNDGYSALGIGIISIFILINSILYGFGAAIQTVNDNVIEQKEKEGDKKSRKLLEWIANPLKLIYTIHISNMILNMITGAYLFRMIVTFIEDAIFNGIYIWLYSFVTIVLIIIFTVLGIFVAKKIAVKNAEGFIYLFYGFISLILILLYPITFMINFISSGVIKVFHFSPNYDEDNVTEEEIITMVNEGHEQGVLLESEAQMINNIFEFGDKEAQDIMIHRKNVIAIDGNHTIGQAFDIIIGESNTRFPVFDKDIDNIVGILHLRDLIKTYADSSKRELTLIDLKDEMLFEAYFIPETHNINSLFKSMQAEKIHIAIVVDEYGQTSGIVTMEDILEEIVGNIMDEYDEEVQFIQQESEGSYIMDGYTKLDDIEDLLHIEFIDKDFDTLNGFMTSCLGKIPTKGEVFQVEYHGYLFSILDVQNKMIKKVRVKRMVTEDN